MTNDIHINQLVFTQQDKCRVCYTCIRECPVKAIRIENGQATVINERCIGCGNCIKVCSQKAKYFLDTTEYVKELLHADGKVAAIIAPSFPAEFGEIDDYHEFVGMIRALGFDYVSEVSFGADLVAREYHKRHNARRNQSGEISSDCPAIVFYIKHYYPQLVEALVPIASPMVAMTRVMKKKYGNDLKIVFIGPCIAKKAESTEVDVALTFTELRQLFTEHNLTPSTTEPSEFDPPKAGKGAVFPVSRGLLQASEIKEDISDGGIIVAEGRAQFPEAIKEFENGLIRDHNLELLCCDGCIMGPGTSKGGKRYARRSRITHYTREKLDKLDKQQWQKDMEEFANLDLSQTFLPDDRRFPAPSHGKIRQILESMGKFEPQDHLNCGACGYDTCEEHAIAIANGFAEEEMCLPHNIEKLHNLIEDLNISNENLANARQALKQSEKLAHMGQLSAGIAHELNNPLGVITMYSNILKEETPEKDPMREDLSLIVEQAERCKIIVSGLLNFARKNQLHPVKADLAEFIQKSIASIIHPDNIKIEFIKNIENPMVDIDREQFMQVLTNLEKNAVEAMPDGGTISIRLEGSEDEVSISIRDTGTGISKENMDKIFTPFFTTKGVGKGTGLGLPLVYGIVKMHKGRIDVTSNTDPEVGQTGTEFFIVLPRRSELYV